MARRRGARRTVHGLLAGTAGLAICALILPGATASAASAASGSGTNPTSLKAVLAKANHLSQQIDVLSQQYDGLQVQLSQARKQAKVAQEDAAVDRILLGKDEKSISAIAVEGYMSGGISPALELLQSADPQTLLNRASIMSQITQENDQRISQVATAATAAQRATAAAGQEQQRAAQLSKEMAGKVAQIQQKENFFNGEAFQQAEAIFERTGHYPNIHVSGDSLGVQALKWALAEIGKPYVWGDAGPNGFDCSGLVVWAYEHVGIYLTHFTGAQWMEVKHIPRSELKPGDLVFFFADISHVGMYVGHGLMVDAPTFGQDVQIQPIFWNAFVGAGEVVG
jgi:peptidoglycan DL-endopeptidase CwlO